MQITFHGAARTVTGSKHLIKLANGKKILLDCGFFQGKGADTDPMNRSFGFDPATVDCLILSHAHIDHSGNIPNLVKQGFKGKIYCTPATYDFAKIMLMDTAHIQENDLEYLNERREKKGQQLLKPIYDGSDVQRALALFVQVPYNTKQEVENGVDFNYTNSGHIPGAAAVNLTITEGNNTKKVFFSGDIGRPNDKILKKPEAFPQADIILCESTYGNRLHESPEQTENRLFEIVTETCVIKKGKLIIPAFSLGRTQEVVFALNNLRNAGKLPTIPVYVDSPLSTNATDVLRAHKECFNNEFLAMMKNDPDPFGFDTLHYVQKVEESVSLNNNRSPMIIISASGMAEAGRVKHHIKNNIENPNCTVLIVGYCTPESLGGRLSAGIDQVRIFGKEYSVKARVEVMNSYSAHGDYNEMLEYLACQDPSKVEKVFLVHGEYMTQIDWREKLKKKGFGRVEIPDMKSTWEI